MTALLLWLSVATGAGGLAIAASATRLLLAERRLEARLSARLARAPRRSDALPARLPQGLAGAAALIGARQWSQLLAARRAREITAEFPFLLDLMLMMLQSGVALDQCFRAIARDEVVALPRHSRQMALLVADLDRGMDYEPALDRWAARLAIPGAQELAALFRQGLFQGVELTPALREFAREFAQRRIARAREAMGSVTVRMVVLMILFLMPALFVVLAGPPVTAIFDTLQAGAR